MSRSSFGSNWYSISGCFLRPAPSRYFHSLPPTGRIAIMGAIFRGYRGGSRWNASFLESVTGTTSLPS